MIDRDTALVVAAHGSHAGGAEPAARIAAALDHRTGVAEVTAAFHQGAPGFDRVLDQIAGSRVVIVPLFTSDGYYVRSVLPASLERNRRRERLTVTIAPPVGVHRRVPWMVARSLRHQFAEQLRAPGAEVLVVGHGTERDARSGASTRALARNLRALGVAPRVEPAFLDQEPRIERVAERRRRGPLVVFPFLVGGGDHVSVDLPRRLGLEGPDGPDSDRASVLIARPFGSIEELTDLVAESFTDQLHAGVA